MRADDMHGACRWGIPKGNGLREAHLEASTTDLAVRSVIRAFSPRAKFALVHEPTHAGTFYGSRAGPGHELINRRGENFYNLIYKQLCCTIMLSNKIFKIPATTMDKTYCPCVVWAKVWA